MKLILIFIINLFYSIYHVKMLRKLEYVKLKEMCRVRTKINSAK
jgi:hypothetical protein